MFFTIEPFQFERNKELLRTMFQLRARVFHDELGWDVEVNEGLEYDAYDQLSPVYLVWQGEKNKALLGSLRLLPTTGPTLLSDVFHDTLPADFNLSAPGIWEGTRLCIDQEALADEHPEIEPKFAFCHMLLALCELGIDKGIQTLISNYEPPTKRLYQMAGAPLEFLGKADGYGKRPVCAGAFRVAPDVLAAMRNKLGITKRLLSQDLPITKAVATRYAA